MPQIIGGILALILIIALILFVISVIGTLLLIAMAVGALFGAGHAVLNYILAFRDHVDWKPENR